MKKFLALVLSFNALLSFAENPLNPSILFELQDDDDFISYALNKDLQLQHLIMEGQEDETTISILSLNSFTIEKTFTVPFDKYDIVELGIDNGELWITQNMFNNDDKWEFIVWQNDGENQAVYNEDGECLGIIANYEIENVIINGSVACFGGYGEGDYEWAYLQFKGSEAGVRTLSLQTQSAVAYPNPVKQNNKFTVDFMSPLSIDGKMKIYDTSGRTVYRKSVKAGESSVNVPSVRLKKGLYFYVIEKGGTILVSDKLIVD